MKKFITPRTSRIIAGMVVASAFAVAPVAAQAATTNATGTLSAGSLSNSAPAITAFTGTLTGVNQTLHAAVGAWNLNDAVGDAAAYHVTVSAGAPTIAGTSIAASLGSTWLVLTPTTATADPSNPVQTAGPTAVATPVALGATAASIDSAAAATGAGQWDFAADSGATKSLAVTIPGDAASGAYVDTLTYTIAAGA